MLLLFRLSLLRHGLLQTNADPRASFYVLLKKRRTEESMTSSELITIIWFRDSLLLSCAVFLLLCGDL